MGLDEYSYHFLLFSEAVYHPRSNNDHTVRLEF